MKTPIKKKATRPKSPPQFTLDMDSKGLAIFLTLVVLTGATIFYLGVIFGKSLRDPKGDLPDLTSKQTGEEEKAKELPKDLKIYDIRDPKKEAIGELKQDFANLSQQADQAIKESTPPQAPAKAEETAPPAASPAAPATNQPAEKKPAWPETTSTDPVETELYTIQVLATKDKDKADGIIRELKKKSFNAFVAPVDIQGQTLYRVRVGKGSKGKIEALAPRLKKAVEGLVMGSLSIQKLN